MNLGSGTIKVTVMYNNRNSNSHTVPNTFKGGSSGNISSSSGSYNNNGIRIKDICCNVITVVVEVTLRNNVTKLLDIQLTLSQKGKVSDRIYAFT